MMADFPLETCFQPQGGLLSALETIRVDVVGARDKAGTSAQIAAEEAVAAAESRRLAAEDREAVSEAASGIDDARDEAVGAKDTAVLASDAAVEAQNQAAEDAAAAARAKSDAWAAADQAVAAGGTAATASAAAAAATAEAKVARDAALANAQVYATTAAGLAATAEGAQFAVPSADGTKITRYTKTGGSAVAIPGAEYPTKGGIDAQQISAAKAAWAAASNLPGEDVVLVQGRNGVALGVSTRTGKIMGSIGSDQLDWLGVDLTSPTLPGETVLPIVTSRDGEKVYLGIDTATGKLWPEQVNTSPIPMSRLQWTGVDLGGPALPGETVIPVITSFDGKTTYLGIDTATGKLWPEPTLPETGTGTAIDFSDAATLGNVWMGIRTSDGTVRYLSDQWAGRTIGFEQRGDITVAQTPDPAIGMVAFGGGSAAVARPLPEEYPWHVVDETLTAPEDKLAAQATAAAHLAIEDVARRALCTVIPLTQVIASTVEADALPNAPGRADLIARVTAAREALAPWGKGLFIDRIALSLLEGAPATPLATADYHYAVVAAGLRQELAEASGQDGLPLVVVSQSGGTRTDGTSEVILAEGRLHLAHWSLGFVSAGPRYPFPLQAGTLAAMTPEGAAQVSEIEALAASEVLRGRQWFPPSLEAATVSGATVTARFRSLSPLILRDTTRHGFAIAGSTITTLAVTGADTVQITLTAAPAAGAVLRYAFGASGDAGDGYCANRGSLTDSWSQASRLVPGATLYRYALSGAAPIQQGA